MPWTTPHAWTSNELVTAALMNEISADLSYVHNGKQLSTIFRNSGSTYSTTSATWVDIDTANLTTTFNVTTGRVFLYFLGTFYASATNKLLHLDFTVDGTRIGSNMIENLDPNARIISLLMPSIGLSVGSHTFRVQWEVDAGGTAFLFQSPGSPAWFDVWEI